MLLVLGLFGSEMNLITNIRLLDGSQKAKFPTRSCKQRYYQTFSTDQISIDLKTWEPGEQWDVTGKLTKTIDFASLDESKAIA